MADDKEVEKTIAEDLVVTKYKLAGQIVNRKFFPICNFALEQLDTQIDWLIRKLCEWDGWTRVIASPCGLYGDSR